MVEEAIPASAKAAKVARALKDRFVGYASPKFLQWIMQGLVVERMKNVRADQVWTIIASCKDFTEIWKKEDGCELPTGTYEMLVRLNRWVDVKKNLERFDPVIEEYGGELALEILKKNRPDLYEVFNNTPGGKKLLHNQVLYLKEELKKLAECL